MLENKQITVGQLAKQANVSVRTLQYYDKLDLLKPSTISAGGRRHYKTTDISILHQIITLKSLGLSLADISLRLKPTNDVDDIVVVLNQQSELIVEQISKSQKILESIDMLKNEIRVSNHVDWSKYSNMVKLINDNNEYYWVENFLEKDIFETITKTHERYDDEVLSAEWLKELIEHVINLDERSIKPESEEAQILAANWWKNVQIYTKGDPKLIEEMFKFYNSDVQWPAEFGEIQKRSQVFMEKMIGYFLFKNNISVENNNGKGKV